MKKLNKKGLSIIELIVSIALISVVMLFIYRMMDEITFEKDNDFFASKNQMNRIELIDMVEEYLYDNKVSDISYTTSTLTFKKNGVNMEKQVSVSGKTISFGSRKWELDEMYSFGNGWDCNKFYQDSGDLGFICKLEVYTSSLDNSEENNNTLDDIVITYYYENSSTPITPEG